MPYAMLVLINAALYAILVNEYVMQETNSNGLVVRILFNPNVHAHGYRTVAPYDVLL